MLLQHRGCAQTVLGRTLGGLSQPSCAAGEEAEAQRKTPDGSTAQSVANYSQNPSRALFPGLSFPLPPRLGNQTSYSNDRKRSVWEFSHKTREGCHLSGGPRTSVRAPRLPLEAGGAGGWGRILLSESSSEWLPPSAVAAQPWPAFSRGASLADRCSLSVV